MNYWWRAILPQNNRPQKNPPGENLPQDNLRQENLPRDNPPRNNLLQTMCSKTIRPGDSKPQDNIRQRQSAMDNLLRTQPARRQSVTGDNVPQTRVSILRSVAECK